MPSSGNAFLVLGLTLQNTGAKVPLSANPVLFSVTTSGSLVVSASVAQPPGECSPTVSVATGGQVQCQIAFEIPMAQMPTTLAYDDQRGDTASAPIPAIVMLSGSCQKVYGWVSSSSSTACLTCLAQAAPSPDAGAPGPCTPAGTSYDSSCASCSGQCFKASDVCTCETGCDSNSCQTLFDSLMSCVYSACSSSCP
jgi:hypothetical protein